MPSTPSPVADVPRMLCVPEVASILGCTQTHVAKLIESGKLAAFNFASDKAARALYRVPVKWLEDFLAASVVL